MELEEMLKPEKPVLTFAQENERRKIIKDNLVFGGEYQPRLRSGGIEYYEGLTPAGMALLIERGYADPQMRQNAAPSIGEINAFCSKHPGFTMFGYVVGPERPDCRVSVEGVCGKPGCLNSAGVSEFSRLFGHADQFDLGGDGRPYYAWFD